MSEPRRTQKAIIGFETDNEHYALFCTFCDTWSLNNCWFNMERTFIRCKKCEAEVELTRDQEEAVEEYQPDNDEAEDTSHIINRIGNICDLVCEYPDLDLDDLADPWKSDNALFYEVDL